ncbi:MAG: hypothetical protein ACI9QD_000176 [Thermoproteota archaeon]|jgi:hypothetical protein
MELDQAIKTLKKTVKPSTSLDEFLHMDLSLIPAAEQEEYQLALKTIYKLIYEGELTMEAVRSKLFV